ncbi:MAG: helix-turn-helix domain-containing protein [Chryseobacterium sp.]|uniref:helix-turn-helix domain-containing protein n=1 Tax=Chryseobacterium sp. TaxID=1871047 RepID=UPI0025BDA075|nr:helix-turn-helix domain-containing protein [Chryseobacterium sp.]MCJ7935654.1 helix-turn-helix domain-containing protein [Chryseobacterium sp.]
MAHENKGPNYKKIFTDIIAAKYPEKMLKCEMLLSKENLSVTDVIQLNEMIFGKNDNPGENSQKFRSYDKSTILKILDYQKQNKLSNIQLANHYKLSRNTISKWKKVFLT